jgi:uncharacterized LabA/DUF88 family protein
MPTVIALFIDYENVHYGLVNQYRFKPDASRLSVLILEEVSKDGNILIKKAYADWEKPEFDGVQAALKRAGIEPAYTLSKKTSKAGQETTWKESADAVLLLDALTTLFERVDIEEFVIVTGDRAALDLVHRLTSRGKKVKICALESALAQELQDSVRGEVISIEKLLGIEPLRYKPLEAAKLVDSAGKPDWKKVILKLAELEGKMPFVGCKLARTRYGFTQEILNEGQTRGIFEIFTVSNPDNPERPTSAVRLNKANEEVTTVLPKRLDIPACLGYSVGLRYSYLLYLSR